MEARLFHDLTDGRFAIAFPLFDMSLGKGPVAGIMLDQKDPLLPFVSQKNDGAAGPLADRLACKLRRADNPALFR